MSLDREVKTKLLGATVTASFHAEVNAFVDDRNWNMSEFIRIAIKESMVRVVRKEKRSR